MQLRRHSTSEPDWTHYLLNQRGITFTSTGWEPLYCALGGGWAQGRIVNVVGDKAVGKTLLAIEAAANFAMQEPKGLIRYKEAESAFDQDFAAVLGMPLDRVDFEEDFNTVEELHKDVVTFTEKCRKRRAPGLYFVDSLDALSDKAEEQRGMDEGSYGAKKAALMSQFFRREKSRLKDNGVTLFIISQVRDNIGVSFGQKWTRSGGRALDFYASQIVYLSQKDTIWQTVKGHKRAVGLNIRAMVRKNKCGMPFREADFSIKFGYGIDDVRACKEYLDKARVKHNGTTDLKALVRATWVDVERSFLPKSRKYAAV
jgi:recombination protein RecA